MNRSPSLRLVVLAWFKKFLSHKVWRPEVVMTGFAMLSVLIIVCSIFFVWRFPVIDPHEEEAWENTKTREEINLERSSLLKIGFVTDWEYSDRTRLKQKITSEAPIELGRVITYFNQTFHPDLVIGGGDYIESSNAKPLRAKQQLMEMNKIFARVTAPRLYAFGDHDFRALTQTEVMEALGITETHGYRDIGDWRIVVIDPNYNQMNEHRNAKQYVFGHMSPDELAWLEASLQTERPIIVFSHYSPIPIPNSKGQYVENIDNASEVRRILENSGRVAAVFSGHNPMGYYEKRQGIPYFVIDTLVNRKAMGSFATIEARYLKDEDYTHFFVRQYGMNKVEYSVDGRVGDQGEHLILAPPFEYQLPDEMTESELLDQ